MSDEETFTIVSFRRKFDDARLRTFTIASIRQRRFVGDVLASTEKVSLYNRSFLLQLPPEGSMVILLLVERR